jgi:hypothetical protein
LYDRDGKSQQQAEIDRVGVFRLQRAIGFRRLPSSAQDDRPINLLKITWQKSYCPEGAAPVLSAVGTASPLPILVKNGKKGVTSKGILSDSAVIAMGFVLIRAS